VEELVDVGLGHPLSFSDLPSSGWVAVDAR
jgi:hypothetical protein